MIDAKQLMKVCKFIKIMVFSEITWFGNYCSLIMRPETLQMQTTYEVNKGV